MLEKYMAYQSTNEYDHFNFITSKSSYDKSNIGGIEHFICCCGALSDSRVGQAPGLY